MATRKKRTPVINHDPLEDLDAAASDEMSVPAVPDVEPVIETSPASKQINLGDSLSIQEVAHVMTEMVSALDLGEPITISGGEVERIDGAGLQLLCMLMKAGQEKAVVISWSSASETVLEGARQLGLREILRLDNQPTEM